MQTKNHHLSYIIVFVSMLYVTTKLVCNPLFFRHTETYLQLFDYHLKMTCTAFVFPCVYMLSDVILAIAGRKTAIILTIFAIACDGIFSFTINYMAHLAIPAVLSHQELLNLTYVDALGQQMWVLYYHGVLATIVTSIAELIIFSELYRKINHFFLSAMISTIFTLTVHNIITDYPLLSNQPDAWKVLFDNLIINISSIAIFILLMMLSMRIYTFIKMHQRKIQL